MRFWRTAPATAWEHPLVEWARTATTSYCSLVLDCDSRESQELSWAVAAGYGDLPRPNVAAMRASSGHQQVWLWKQAARARKGGLIGGRTPTWTRRPGGRRGPPRADGVARAGRGQGSLSG